MHLVIQRTTLILVIVLFFLQGCAATQQRRDVVKTGFLSDYSLLTEGKGDDHEALLRYMNPDADWRSYDKIIFDSVTVCATIDLNSLYTITTSSIVSFI